MVKKMKEHLISQWKDISSNFKWRIIMQCDKLTGHGEVLHSTRTIVFENINLIISWFGDFGQIKYISGKYPEIKFCHNISYDEFKELYNLYEGNSIEQEKEVNQLKELRIKYPHA